MLKAAFLAIGLFLHINGHRLSADRVDAIRTTLALATGQVNERGLAEWTRANTR